MNAGKQLLSSVSYILFAHSTSNDLVLRNLRFSQRIPLFWAVRGWAVTDVSTVPIAIIIKVKQSPLFLGLLDPEDEGTTVFRNVSLCYIQ